MRKIVDYNVVTVVDYRNSHPDNPIGKFEKSIKELIREGYELYGSLNVSVTEKEKSVKSCEEKVTGVIVVYTQALVKYEE